MDDVDTSAPQSDKAAVGARLREFREHLKLSQVAFAKEIGGSKRGLQGNESGISMPGGEVLSALIHKGLNLTWLLHGTGEMLVGSPATVDLQREDAQWQIAKMAMLELPIDTFADQATSRDEAAGFVKRYNEGAAGVSSMLRELIPSISVAELRAWLQQARRWQQRFALAQRSVEEHAPGMHYSPSPRQSVLIDQALPVHLDESELARIITAVRNVVASTGMERVVAASVAAELYAQMDPYVNRNLLLGVMSGIWRAHAEYDAPVLPPHEEARVVSELCNQLQHSEGQPKGLTGTNR
ncbi:MAG: helix-turn-helix transcriptional regulator [Pseudomonadota bacterium]